MHAAIMNLTIDPALAPQAAAKFSSEPLPAVQAAPGFVADYWVDPVERRGLGFILFDREEQARAATPRATAGEAPGVHVERVDIRRVAAAIP